MNELDTQRMTGILMQEGILPAHRPDQADIILLNSCSVRDKAQQKVQSRLGRFRLLKRDKPELLIGLCGCVAQQEGERALKRAPGLDFVLGPARLAEIRTVIERRRQGERVVATGFPEERSYVFDTICRDGSHKGMVTIIEGCNKKCTFCVVPFTRGPESCRDKEEILAEVAYLVDSGFLEIELLGQTVNHWRDPDSGEDFADLLGAVAELPGVARLRFVTSYPRDFSDAMVERIGRHENICPYLHLPVQSGSDRMLRRMGRGYTVEEYRSLARKLRKARTDLALSTDLIVGFPGETEEDFRATLELLESMEFASIFAFCYSPRPLTAALRLREEEVDPDTSAERLQRLLARQQPIQQRLNQSLVGSEQTVLVTGWSGEGETASGRTPCHRAVHFPFRGEAMPAVGSMTRVRVTRALPHSLLGELLAPAATAAAGPAQSRAVR
jgi:tRNA-2-methylthio-N6-dimethylallyladenosine synthase